MLRISDLILSVYFLTDYCMARYATAERAFAKALAFLVKLVAAVSMRLEIAIQTTATNALITQSACMLYTHQSGLVTQYLRRRSQEGSVRGSFRRNGTRADLRQTQHEKKLTTSARLYERGDSGLAEGGATQTGHPLPERSYPAGSLGTMTWAPGPKS